MTTKKPKVERYGYPHYQTYRGNQIMVKDSLYLEGSVESAIDTLKKSAESLEDPEIIWEAEGYDDTYRYYMIGFRDMLPAELKHAGKVRAEQAKKKEELDLRQEDFERKQYEKLKAKFKD